MLLQNLQSEFAEAIKNNDKNFDIITPSQNITIYHNNVISNFTSVLETTYPLLIKLLGEEYFQGLAKEYISQYPATSELNNYGEYFSDFIDTIESLKNLPYLNEVAQFEWRCHTAFYAADPAEINLGLLKTLSPAQYADLHFSLHPACELMQFKYPILKIIDLCHGLTEEEIHLSEGGVNLLITRQAFDIKLIPLKLGEFKFLEALKNNASLAEALAIVTSIDSDFNLEEKLPLWIKEKTIVDII